MFIETLVDEKLAPGNGAVSVQSFFADHMHFRAKVKRNMRIDVEYGISAFGDRWRKGKSVGACLIFFFRLFPGCQRIFMLAIIKTVDLRYRNTSGVDGADTAVGPQQGIPGFKTGK